MACLVAPVLGSVPVAAAPITFNTALPVSKAEWLLHQQFIHGEASRAGQKMRALMSMTVVGYGLAPDLSLFAMIPWIHRDFSMAQGVERHAEGVGDLQLMARYTAYQHDFQGGTFRLSPFGGVKVPTGEYRERDALGLLPPGLQPGSGSWDVVAGVVASYASIDLNIDGQLFWQINNRADAVARGDVFRADLSFQGRIFPKVLSGDTRGFLFGTLELNLKNEKKTRIGGMTDPNSGGMQLFATPGLQYATKRWIAEAAVQIPVTQNLNGTNLASDYAVFAGLRLNF